MKKINIAIAGATGNVGRKIIEVLHERDFPVNNIYPLASSASRGKQISFGDKTIVTTVLDEFDFSKADLVFSCLDSKITKTYAEKAANKGCVIIDKSSLYRMDKDVPLIVPEVNEHILASIPAKRIISSPNCIAIPLTVALSPLHNAANIKRIVCSTYQSVSGAGKKAMDELYDQTKNTYMTGASEPKEFERQMAFNIIPKIDHFNDNNDSLEEEKICQETKKILNKDFSITATSVRVPVFIGHSISCNVEFSNNITANEAEEILQEAEGINLISTNGDVKYITPKEVVGEDMVFVSRLRDDISNKNTLNMWISCDNLRKGAATNAVQIAETIYNLL